MISRFVDRLVDFGGAPACLAIQVVVAYWLARH